VPDYLTTAQVAAALGLTTLPRKGQLARALDLGTRYGERFFRGRIQSGGRGRDARASAVRPRPSPDPLTRYGACGTLSVS